MPIIKPTIGRVVHYYYCHTRDIKRVDGPYASLIVHIWSDVLVNLAAFDINGRIMDGATSVRLVHPGDTAPAGESYCCWPPYAPPFAASNNSLPSSNPSEIQRAAEAGAAS